VAATVFGAVGGAVLAAAVALACIRIRRKAHGIPTSAKGRALLSNMFADANILVWWATVRGTGDQRTWTFDVPGAGRGSTVGRMAGESTPGGLWVKDRLPDRPEMVARTRSALDGGAPGYRQEFRVQFEGREHWVRESVKIERLGKDSWSLFGVVADITPEREADEALRQSQEQLKAILDRADCMVWQARVIESNGTFEWHFNVPDSGLQRRIFGGRQAFRFDGRSGPGEKKLFGDYVVPEQNETDARFMAAVRGSVAGYDQEFHLVSPERTFLVQERVSVTPVGPGAWNIVGLVVDITARHDAEEARKASQAQLHGLLEKIDCILWQARATRNGEGTVDWAFLNLPPSRLYRKIFGKDPSENNNRLWDDANRPPEMDQMDRRSVGAMVGGASGYEQEFRAVSQGREMWLREQVSIVPAGPDAWSVFGVATDVTARRLAETALATEKERLAVTLRAMDEAVVTVDTHGVVQFMNLMAEKLTDCRQGAGVGRRVEAVLTVAAGTPAAGPSDGLPIQFALRDGLAVDIPAGVEIRSADGRPHLIEGCCAPVRSERSEIIGAVLVFRDVTERQRLRADVERASKLESIGLLAGGIAHDFNNLLTAIMGNLTLATLDLDKGRSVKEYLEGAQAASLRARDLTQQMLTFAKGGEPVCSAVQLPGIVEEVARFALRGSRAKCEFALEAGLWPANADKGQIGQIIQNLVINAVQAMPGGGVIRIGAGNETVSAGRIAALSPGDYVHIYVADTGVGISPDVLANIFDPYFTTKKQGNGLGLATVYSIVRKHKGHVTVNSSVGKGATFHIWLPALKSEVVADGGGAAEPSRSFSGRILVMDDEDAIRIMAARLFQRIGFEVDVASDGAEAVEKFRAAHASGRGFGAVVMDLTVPGGMGGCEALAGMREISPDVRAIVSSGYSGDAVMANYRAYGFRGMVAKPYALEDVTRVLREVLPPGSSHAA
jgi:signal transduction histidine kinase/CheY-like chemotaxis protein